MSLEKKIDSLFVFLTQIIPHTKVTTFTKVDTSTPLLIHTVEGESFEFSTSQIWLGWGQFPLNSIREGDHVCIWEIPSSDIKIFQLVCRGPSIPKNSPSELLEFLSENGYEGKSVPSKGTGVKERLEMNCGAIITIYNSGKALIQGDLSQQKDLKTLLKSQDFLIK